MCNENKPITQGIDGIGWRIKCLRKLKSIKQQQLAHDMGIFRQVISKWETGTQYPDVEQICYLADYFGVTCDYLIRGIQSPNIAAHRVTGFSNQTINKLSDWKDSYPFANRFFDLLIGHPVAQLLCYYAKQTCRYQVHQFDNLHGRIVEELDFEGKRLSIIDNTEIPYDDWAQLFKMKTIDTFSGLLNDVTKECVENAQKRNS